MGVEQDSLAITALKVCLIKEQWHVISNNVAF